MKILFLVDTSASMGRITKEGISILDTAKSAIERFISARRTFGYLSQDQYFLATTSKSAHSTTFMKFTASLKKNPDGKIISDSNGLEGFKRELKMLQVQDVSYFVDALTNCFDFLNRYRLRADIDNFGKGRIPWNLDPTCVIVLSDGGNLFFSEKSNSFISNLSLDSFATNPELLNEFKVPEAANALYSHSFRWDQRVFVAVIQSPKGSERKITPGEASPDICRLSDFTGGEYQIVNSLKNLTQWFDVLAGKLASFEKGFCCQLTKSESVKRLCSHIPEEIVRVFVKCSQDNMQKFWPFPEDTIENAELPQLPRRLSFPIFLVDEIVAPEEELLVEKFFNNRIPLPFDRYELHGMTRNSESLFSELREMCSLQKKHSISGLSGYLIVSMYLPKQGISSKFFSIIRPASSGNYFDMFALPYDFLELFSLQESDPRYSRSRWLRYIASVPCYYLPMLNQVLGTRIPLFNQVYQELFINGQIKVGTVSPEAFQRFQFQRQLPVREFDAPDMLGTQKISNNSRQTLLTMNPANMSRSDVIKSFDSLSSRLWRIVKASNQQGQLPKDLIEAENISSRFELPVAEMGNYEKYAPLREVHRNPLSEEEEKGVNFGNRYQKKNKTRMNLLAVDEADGLSVSSGDSESPRSSSSRYSRSSSRSRTPPSTGLSQRSQVVTSVSDLPSSQQVTDSKTLWNLTELRDLFNSVILILRSNRRGSPLFIEKQLKELRSDFQQKHVVEKSLLVKFISALLSRAKSHRNELVIKELNLWLDLVSA